MNLDDLTEEELMRLYEMDPEQVTAAVAPKAKGVPSADLLGHESGLVKAGLKDAAADTPITRKRDEAREEEDETTSYKYEPDRPKFGSIPSGEKPRMDFKTEEIKKVLAELDKAQTGGPGEFGMGGDKGRTRGSRRLAISQVGEEAATVGIGGLKPSATRYPMPDKWSESKAVEQKAKLSDTLQTGEMKRQNPEEERDLKNVLTRLKLQEDAEKALAERERKNADREDKQEHDTTERGKDRGLKASEGDKNRAANIVAPILRARLTEDNKTGRADAEFANRQAERQLFGWDDLAPHSATENTKGGHLAGSEAAIQAVGRKAVAAMRKNGRNFPQSTEWQKLESEMNLLHEEFNKAHENGVMNFGDKDNRIVEIGDPQSFKQFVLNNGPDVLENALNNMAATTDAKMAVMKYKRNKNWRPRMPSEYMTVTTGGRSESYPLQDPNVVGGIIKSVNEGAPMPSLQAPPKGGGQNPYQPSGPGKARWDPVLRKMVDASGRPIE